jgi:hypothetical protein
MSRLAWLFKPEAGFFVTGNVFVKITGHGYYRRMPMPVVRSLALFLIVVSISSAEELKLLQGRSISGKLLTISPSEITMKTDKGKVTIPLRQVLGLEIQPPAKEIKARSYADVRLIDDTLLHCTQISFKGRNVTLTLPSGITLQLPLNQMVWFMREAQDAQLRKKWDELLAVKVKGDRVVVLQQGELNSLEGTFGDMDEKGKTIQFRQDAGEVVPIAVERLHGMIFHRLEAANRVPVCRIIDTQGNTLSVVAIHYDGKKYAVTTTFGSTITFAPKGLAALDFNLGKLTYLSDMTPTKVIERSGAGLVVHYRKDTNLDGEPIRLGKVGYSKGLSIHAHTELEYDLAGKYKQFQAIIAVDPSIGVESQPVVTIVCDGEKRFSRVFTSRDPPQTISLNVKDVAALHIVVSSQNFLDLHDQVTLANALISQ